MQDTIPADPTISKEQKNWAMIGHLSALLFLWSGIGGMLGPFIVWLMRKDDMPFAAQQAKEALNFQITMFLLGILAWILALILIGFLLLGILFIVDLVLTIIAAMKAGEGIAYRYPFNLRLVK